MTMRITATVDPVASRVVARTDGGGTVVMDGDEAEGGRSTPEPKETLLAALAGCTSMDVASILRKKRQRARTYEIVVTGISAEEHPRVFTEISVEHRLSGEVEPEALRRSIELSATRYCPVNATLSALATVEHRYLLTDEGGATHEAVVAITGPQGSRVL